MPVAGRRGAVISAARSSSEPASRSLPWAMSAAPSAIRGLDEPVWLSEMRCSSSSSRAPAGECLGGIGPRLLELAQGEIGEHVRGRRRVLLWPRQSPRLLERNACRFHSAEEIERLALTE